MLTELRNRGVEDALIVGPDALKGLAEAIKAIWPEAMVQTCVIHLLRGSFRYASNDHRKKVAAQLRPVYPTASVDAAEKAFLEFEDGLGKRYPAIVKLWRDQWKAFVPFLAFLADRQNPPGRLHDQHDRIDQLPATESHNNRGHFPNERAAIKLLYLVIRNITTKRGGQAVTGTWGWTACLNQLAIYFPGRPTVV